MPLRKKNLNFVAKSFSTGEKLAYKMKIFVQLKNATFNKDKRKKISVILKTINVLNKALFN